MVWTPVSASTGPVARNHHFSTWDLDAVGVERAVGVGIFGGSGGVRRTSNEFDQAGFSDLDEDSRAGAWMGFDACDGAWPFQPRGCT